MTAKEKAPGKFRLIFPKLWHRIVFAILFGSAIGLSANVFVLSNAISYLSDEPEACINCHVMVPEYATWQHSSHREHTTCNDCHVPYGEGFRKYKFKANDGMRHAFLFTFRLEPQVIRIKEEGKDVVQENCLRCHYDQVHPVSVANVDGDNYKHGEGMLCWGCHREVPHGRVHSQSSTPYSIIPDMSK